MAAEFDPSKPFTVVDAAPAAAPEFDPSKPFKALDATPPAAAAPSQDQSHDFLPFLKNAWEGLKKTAVDTLSMPPQMGGESLAGKAADATYDAAVKTPVDAYSQAREAGFSPGSAALEAADAGTNAVTEGARGLIMPETLPFEAYFKSRQAGNSMTDALKDARNVGALVLGPAAAVKVAAKGAGAAAPAVADFAKDRAASALGLTKAIRNRIGNEAADEAAQVALKEGVITPLASTEDKIARMQAVQDQAGTQIGGVMDQLDKGGAKAFSPGDAAMQVETQLGPTYAGEPLFKGLESQYNNLIDTILKRGDQPISFADAQALKETLGQYAFKEGAAVPGREQAARAYGIVNGMLDDAVESGAKTLPNSPDLLETLQNAKTNYRGAKNAMQGLENKQAAEKGNRFFGLTDTIIGSAGAGIHGGPGAAAAVVGKKIADKFGQNTMAYGADVLSKMMSGENPYAPVLRRAAEEGSQRAAVVHYMLGTRDPGYQALMRAADDQDDSAPAEHQPAE